MTILPWSDEVSVPPKVEPVTVAEAKRNSDYEDSDRDVDFKRWIAEARRTVEHDARVALVEQTRIRTLDELPSDDSVRLWKPLIQVDSFQYTDTGGSLQTFASSNYTVDTSRNSLFLAYSKSWPATQGKRNVATITYKSGYGDAREDVPEEAVAAILMLVRHRFCHPEMATMQGGERKEYSSLIYQLRGGVYP